MSTLGPRSRPVRPVGVAALLAVAASTGLFAWNAQAATSPASSSPVSSAASPATVTAADGVMAYTAADGQTNKLTIKRISETDTTLTFGVDDVVEITAGTDCTHPTATDLTYVTCTVPVPDPDHGGDQGTVELGDGNDSIKISGGDVSVYGGDGDDTINGASVAVGGDGDDTISHTTNANGNAGNDTITDSFAVWGGDGDDTVIAMMWPTRSTAGPATTTSTAPATMTRSTAKRATTPSRADRATTTSSAAPARTTSTAAPVTTSSTRTDPSLTGSEGSEGT